MAFGFQDHREPGAVPGAAGVTVDGLILAAGASRRMGSPKPLLPFQGQTFLDTLIEKLSRHCRSVTVVLGHQAAGIRSALARADEVTFVENSNYQEGQLSSVQAGLHGLLNAAPHAEHILLTLADHPAVADATLSDLVSLPALLAIPRYQGRHGHPIFFGRPIADELLALPAGASARHVIHAHREQTRFVDVEDPGILLDIDDPASYASLLRSSTSA